MDFTLRVFYIGFANSWWLDVAEHLQRELDLQPVCWTGSKHHGISPTNIKRFPDCRYFDTFHSVRGIINVDNLEPLDPKIIEQMAPYDSMVVRMMERVDAKGNRFTTEERYAHYYRLMEQWLTVIKQLKPDLVLFPESPHNMYDYVLYALCKVKGIRTVMFEHMIINNYKLHSYMVENIEDSSQPITRALNEKAEILPEIEKAIKGLTIKDYSQAEPYYMVRLKKDAGISRLVERQINWLKHIILYAKRTKSLKIYHPSYQKLEKTIREPIKILDFFRYISTAQIQLLINRRRYRQLTKDIDYKNEKYIYLAPNYQPERTSRPNGGYFADILLQVKMLCRTLPKDWKIVYKEHPSQFIIPTGVHCKHFYPFYDELRRLKQVVCVRDDANSFTLIDHSQAVATSTGTIGIESVARGKCALVFGSVWYDQCPGVFKIKTKGDISKAIETIQSGFCPSFEDVCRYASTGKELSKEDIYLVEVNPQDVTASRIKATADYIVNYLRPSINLPLMEK